MTWLRCKLLLNLAKLPLPARLRWAEGCRPPWTSAACRETRNPRQEPGPGQVSHLPLPPLDSQPHAERDHHWLLYEPGLEGAFSTHTSSISEGWGLQGKRGGEGVPEHARSQEDHVSSSHTAGPLSTEAWPAHATEGGGEVEGVGTWSCWSP